MTERNLPWAYRPREFDDWGFIRDASGDLAACARGDKGRRSHDGHRAAGTDPYGDYAAFIVQAVNNHDALVQALREFMGHWEKIPMWNAKEVNVSVERAREVLAAVESSPLPLKEPL